MYYSAVFVHTIYIYAWVLMPLYIINSIIDAFYGKYIHSLLIILYYLIRSIFPAEKCEFFQDIMINLKPSNYYNKCSIGNIPKITEKTMVCYHPHGIFCGGYSWNGAFHQKLGKSGITWLVAPALFSLPLFSDLISWMGFDSVEKNNMRKLMKDNKPIALLPGGFHEVAILEYNVDSVYVPFGFIKMALRHGYKIIPTYTFGECRAYWTVKLPLFLQRLLVKMKLPAVLFWGKWLMYPNNNIEIKTVFGNPIQCPKIINPNNKQVRKFRKRYIRELLQIGVKCNIKISLIKEF